MEPLRTKWRGKEFQLSYTLEVTFWRSERLPEIAKDQRSRGAPANATSASFSRKWSVPGITRQWGGGPRSRSASLAMGPANARTSGEPTRLRTHARVCGPNSVVPMAEAIRRSEPTASPGARNVPSSRRSKRTSVWSPAVRFARIASRGLVGANPAAGNGTVVERSTGQGRRIPLGEHDVGRPSLVKSAERDPLLVVQPESDEDDLPHRSARMAGRLFSFPPKTLNRVPRNRGPCGRGVSSCRRSLGKKSDVG